MNFSGLVTAVQEFWSFFWPAAVCLAILLGIVKVIAPVAATRISQRIQSLKPSDQKQIAAFKTAKRFGFDKLVPILAAFCLLFLMDVAKTTVVGVGDVLPPNVVYRYEIWLLNHASDERLFCLWAHFDDAPSLNSLQNDVERSLSEVEGSNKDSQVFGNLRNWTEKSADAHEGFSACKFFILWGIVWGVAEMFVYRQFFRTPLLIALCAALFFLSGLVFLVRHMYAVEQEQYARVTAVESFLFEKPPACHAIAPEKQTIYSGIVDESHQRAVQRGQGRWWNIRFFDFDYSGWIWRELFQPVNQSPGLPMDLIVSQQWAGGHVEETQEDAEFYLIKASVSRPYITESGQRQTPTRQPATEISPAETKTIVRETITPSTLTRYAGKRILWVDDHPENNTYEVHMFTSLGMVVDQSTSTSGALNDLSKNSYDVVITDMRRGDNDFAGYELLDRMHERDINMPVFVYSASSNEEYRAKAMTKGARDETNDPGRLLQFVTGALVGSTGLN